MNIELNKEISIENAASILGISVATARNWIRHKYLSPIKNNGSVSFETEDIYLLKDKIESGELGRLKTRANKGNAKKKFIPGEHVVDDEIENINTITNIINKNNFNIDLSLLFLTINFLYRNKFLSTLELNKITEFKSKNFENEYVLTELKEWIQKLDLKKISNDYSILLSTDLPDKSIDVLGIIYQSVLHEGTKSKRGSYYTPKEIIEEISNEYVTENQKVLDPCCGTGQFLLTIGNRLKNPENLYGIDIDYLATKIAKFNLIVKFSDKDFKPNIYYLNTLLDFNGLFSNNLPIDEIDLITTNPPWGVHFSKEDIYKLNSYYPQIKSLESFSYFIVKSYEYLKKGGVLSFILPESILNVKTHSDIRKYILKNFEIINIESLGRVFQNVFTKVIRLDLKKTKPNRNKVHIKFPNNNYKVYQNRFENNNDNIFDIHLNPIEEKILDRVYNHKHLTLKNNADWALGIVTGDNSKYVSEIKYKNMEPIYRGSDVNKYVLNDVKRFIEFIPSKFQQVAPVEKYRAKEKLIYRFISNKLIFAFDDKQRLTLNSANILIPQIDGFPIKIFAAFLNSSLFQFIYQKKINSIKVLRSHLETLPFPVLSHSESQTIQDIVNKILQNNSDYNVVDEYIFDLFKITGKERKQLLMAIN